MQNSLNLSDALDGVEIIHEVERTFGISIADHEALATKNVGQLYDLIEAKCGTAEKTQACLSQIAFYKIRRALASVGVTGAVPSTPISVVCQQGGSSINQFWNETAQRSGLTFPPLETRFVFAWTATKSGRIVASIGMICLLGGVFAVTRGLGFSPGWVVLGLIGGFVPGIIVLNRVLLMLFGDIPRRIETVGDLAREAAGYTYGALRKPWRRESGSDRWFALAAILRQQSGHKLGIDKETTFYSR